MTEEEQAVMNALAEAWNKFLALPTYHPDHVSEVRHAIHIAEHIVLARVALRQQGLTSPEAFFAEAEKYRDKNA